MITTNLFPLLQAWARFKEETASAGIVGQRGGGGGRGRGERRTEPIAWK